MLAKLRQAKEIAVDLEHHSYRSYAGFVCLMQLSTRQEDWIVDTLVLREELVELNEVFTDPEIVKVCASQSDYVLLATEFLDLSWRRERHTLAAAGLQSLRRQSL